MQVIRTFVPDSLQNYNYLAVCEHSGDAAAIDPFDADHLLNIARERGVTIKAIWITHEHGDHIRHLEELKSRTRAPVYAPLACQSRFDADIWLEDGNRLTLGRETAEFWSSPGHTPGHGVFYVNDPEPVLLSGDTLFNAGVGNARSGDPETLFNSIERILDRAAPEARLYPGHDYILNNLGFTLSLLPNLEAAQALRKTVEAQTPDTRSTTTLKQEHEVNLFLRLDDPALIEALTERGFDTSDRKARFIALRRLRDRW